MRSEGAGAVKIIIVYFIAANALLIFFVSLAFYGRRLSEYAGVRAAVRIQTERLAIKERNLAAAEENYQFILTRGDSVKANDSASYETLAGVLISIIKAARESGLAERSFEAGESAAIDFWIRGGNFYGAGVEASYDGAPDDIKNFVRALDSEEAIIIRRVSVETRNAEDNLYSLSLTLSAFFMDEP